eukprot:4240392-Amphidinium_carterae.3
MLFSLNAGQVRVGLTSLHYVTMTLLCSNGCLCEAAEGWLCTTKKGVPIGTRCLTCSQLAPHFAGEAWESLCLQYKTVPKFAKDFEGARSILLEGTPGNYTGPFARETFALNSNEFMEVSQSYELYSPTLFETTFKGKPDEIGLQAEQFETVGGKKISAIPVADGNPKVRMIKLVGSSYAQHLLEVGHAVRAEEGTQLATWYNKDLHGASLVAGLRNPRCKEEMLKDLEEAREKKKKEEEEKAKRDAEAAANVTTVKQEVEEVGSKDEDMEVADEVVFNPAAMSAAMPVLQLPSAKAAEESSAVKGKGRGKGKGGKGKKGADKTRLLPPHSEEPKGKRSKWATLPAANSIPTTNTTSASSASSGSTPSVPPSASGNTVAQKLNKAEKANDSLLNSLPSALDNPKAVGSQLNVARRQQKSLEEAAPGCAEACDLGTQIKLVESACKVAIGNMASLDCTAREAILCDVFPQCYGKVSSEWRLAYIKKIQDELIRDNKYIELIAMMLPFGEPGAYIKEETERRQL